MMKLRTHRTLLCFALLLFGLSTLGTIPGLAQDKEEVVEETKASKSRGSSTKDENIKDDSEENDLNAKGNPPAGKADEKSRGSLVWVTFDNRTPWYVRTYVDGKYRGTVGPYNDLRVIAGGGMTRLYGKARFKRGGDLTWGPRVVRIRRSFRWSLTK